jgi:GT2 family glycosyltransferase
MTKLVISIVTWNSEKTIEACIFSVLNQTEADFILHVFDNQSTDNTLEVLNRFKDKRLHIHAHSENIGFCGGHNFVIRCTQSQYVLLVNPDIIMQVDYVSKAISKMDQYLGVGTLCGSLLQNEEGLIDSAGLKLKRSGTMELMHHAANIQTVNLKECYVFGCDGALPLYRRIMIEDISVNNMFFDELFFAHKEDWDVSWRSALYGWKTLFVPECRALHPRYFKPGNRSLRKNIPAKIKADAVKNQLILFLKNLSAREFLRNFFHIMPKQIIIFIYVLLFERDSLTAYAYIYKKRKNIMAQRRIIQQKRKVKTLV